MWVYKMKFSKMFSQYVELSVRNVKIQEELDSISYCFNSAMFITSDVLHKEYNQNNLILGELSEKLDKIIPELDESSTRTVMD